MKTLVLADVHSNITAPEAVWNGEAAAGVAADGDRDRAGQLAADLRAAAAEVKLETRDAMARFEAQAAGLAKMTSGAGK
jgi:hypothetical protein